MRDLVTFFQDHEPDSEKTSQVPHFATTFAAAYTNVKARTKIPTSPEEGPDRWLGKLARWVEANGGGVAVVIFEHQASRTASIVTVPSTRYEPPSQILHLDSFGGAHFRKLAKPREMKKIELRSADHLIIPTSVRAEGQIVDLLAGLEGFPGDTLSLVLNVIRQPSLDARIDEIRDLVSRRPGISKRALNWISRHRQLVSPNSEIRRRQLIASIISATTMLFLAGMIFLFPIRDHNTIWSLMVNGNPKTSSEGSQGDGQGEPGLSGEGTQPATGTPVPTPTIDQTTIDDNLRSLFEQLSSSQGGRYAPLFKNLFPEGTRDTDRALKGNKRKQKDLAWAILKLVLLRVDSSIQNTTYFGKNVRSSPKNDLIRILDNAERGSTLPTMNESDISLISHINCIAFGAPKVPYHQGDGTEQSVRLSYNDCESIPLEEALSGITELREAVARDEAPRTTQAPESRRTPTPTPTRIVTAESPAPDQTSGNRR